MNKCAFVIPLHPKHFEYGYYIFYYLYNKNVDLYFIFTDNTDKDIFFSKIDTNKYCKINFLILENFADIKLIEQINSFVSIKKLFALHKLCKHYDYISCIDSEIKFINDYADYYDIMKNIVNVKIICGGQISPHSSGERNIVRESLTRLTDVKYHNELNNLSKDYTIYTWWSNLPVYDCKIAKKFLRWIDFNCDSLNRFNWFVFDDMAYNFYCLLFHNYTFKLIENCNHSLEFSDSKLVEYVDKNLCKLFWVNNNAYCQNPDYYHKNNFCIVFHLDRWSNIKPLLNNEFKYIV